MEFLTRPTRSELALLKWEEKHFVSPDRPECPHCFELVVDCECAWDASGPAFESRNRALGITEVDA